MTRIELSKRAERLVLAADTLAAQTLPGFVPGKFVLDILANTNGEYFNNSPRPETAGQLLYRVAFELHELIAHEWWHVDSRHAEAIRACLEKLVNSLHRQIKIDRIATGHVETTFSKWEDNLLVVRNGRRGRLVRPANKSARATIRREAMKDNYLVR